ncbi:hypothetical protein FGIG_05791 [Fasciola gigantica]|uniref:Uncharacterized protein n=1 Tax=Fasciola gigantica TaxID=46835 RepID=A0A504YCY5_FASGI|nr:hypothetical protein FGIG_05791 [Fasciola gigantica]
MAETEKKANLTDFLHCPNLIPGKLDLTECPPSNRQRGFLQRSGVASLNKLGARSRLSGILSCRLSRASQKENLASRFQNIQVQNVHTLTLPDAISLSCRRHEREKRNLPV